MFFFSFRTPYIQERLIIKDSLLFFFFSLCDVQHSPCPRFVDQIPFSHTLSSLQHQVRACMFRHKTDYDYQQAVVARPLLHPSNPSSVTYTQGRLTLILTPFRAAYNQGRLTIRGR